MFAVAGVDEERSRAERWWARYAGRIAAAARQRVRVAPGTGPDAGKFPRRVERSLTAELPAAPAAVMLFDRAGYARTIAFDFDAKQVPVRQVEADVAALTALLRVCGVAWLVDGSVSGGRHVYVPLAAPRHVSEVGRLVRAAKAMLPSLDISLVNAGEGCIRPPGSRHRRGGFQRLLCSEEQADRAFAAPAGEEAWRRLCAALTAGRRGAATPGAGAGISGLPADRLAGRGWTPLPDRYEHIARTGDAGGYASGSEARQAVLASAANRGWSLDEVCARLEDGRWSGLRRLYARYRGGWFRALRRDWAKALRWAAGPVAPAAAPAAARPAEGAGAKSPRSVSVPDTSLQPHGGGAGGTTQSDRISDEWISVFLDAVANASPRWGRHAGRNRAVLQSLAYAAWQARSRVIDWGVRSYALGGGLGRSTVALVLAELAAECDPFVTRIAVGVHDQADSYRLRLPEGVSLRRPGPTLKPRPVPDVLIDRPKSGFGVYQTLSSRPRGVEELAELGCYGRATVYRRLTELAELGLARRTGTGAWVRGSRGLVAAAWRTGAYWLRACRQRRYARERKAWRDRLDSWQRPAALIPPPRIPTEPTEPAGPAGPTSPTPPAPPAGTDRTAPPPDEARPPQAWQHDDAWQQQEPPDDPWPEEPPDTPDHPWEMILQLLEEHLGAVPIDEHGQPLYRRYRRRPIRPG